jgi:integrase/recombinase XerD
MQDLYWWTVKQRPTRARQRLSDATPLTELFVTEYGNAYSQNAIGDMFRTLSKRVGFRVTPHMLRHTWATHTLHFLRRSHWRGDPLLYIQARLGHSSLNTTIIYLHLLEHMDVELLESHNNELDMLFSGSIEGLTV